MGERGPWGGYPLEEGDFKRYGNELPAEISKKVPEIVEAPTTKPEGSGDKRENGGEPTKVGKVDIPKRREIFSMSRAEIEVMVRGHLEKADLQAEAERLNRLLEQLFKRLKPEAREIVMKYLKKKVYELLVRGADSRKVVKLMIEYVERAINKLDSKKNK